VFKFLTRQPLWVNILLAIVLVLLVLVIFLGSLGYITKHGRILKIPAVEGKTMEVATQILSDQGFDVAIQDSVYVDTVPPLTVIRQFPEADAAVKINRTVYLTVNRAVPPLIEMPRLTGSFRNAVLTLKQIGLKLGDTTYRADFTKNNVIAQLYKGEEIKPGTKIPMGSTIDLVLSSGLANVDMGVPDLFGMTYGEARAKLDSAGIGLIPIPDPGISDTENAYIYRQDPERLGYDRRVNRIRPGQMIDIWLSSEQKQRAIDTTVQAGDLPPGEN
jgi:eukaryotic-like serine/threonine-protein kinase